jgi:hypothetical protein
MSYSFSKISVLGVCQVSEMRRHSAVALVSGRCSRSNSASSSFQRLTIALHKNCSCIVLSLIANGEHRCAVLTPLSLGLTTMSLLPPTCDVSKLDGTTLAWPCACSNRAAEEYVKETVSKSLLVSLSAIGARSDAHTSAVKLLSSSVCSLILLLFLDGRKRAKPSRTWQTL